MDTNEPTAGPWGRTARGEAEPGQGHLQFRVALAYAALSLLLLAPCFWQPRLEGGDLSSHIYNSWMSGMIENGRTMGVLTVHQWTNILFDLMLSGLFKLFGAE